MSGSQDSLTSKLLSSTNEKVVVPGQSQGVPGRKVNPFQQALDELKALPVQTAQLGSRVQCICASETGVFAGLEDGSVFFLGSEADTLLLGQHELGVSVVSVSSQVLISGSVDGTIKFWSTEKKTELAALSGHTKPVVCLSTSRDGRFVVSGSEDTTVRVWSLSQHKEVATLIGHTSNVTCVSTSKDGKFIVSGSEDESIRIWSFEDFKEVVSLRGHHSSVTSLLLTSDGKLLVSGSGNGVLTLWNLKEKKEIATIDAHPDSVLCLSMTRDEKDVVSGSRDGSIKRWNLDTQKEIATFQGHSASVTCLSVTVDGNFLVSGSGDSTIKLWNFEENKEVATLSEHRDSVTCIAISENGQFFASGSADETVKLWVLEEKEETVMLEGHTDSINCLSLTQDGTVLVSASRDKTVKVWDFHKKTEITTFQAFSSAVTCISIAFDGKSIVLGFEDGKLQIWCLSLYRELATLLGHTSSVTSIVRTPDGQFLISASIDKTIRIWDLESKTEKTDLKIELDTSIWALAVTPDGKILASGLLQGNIPIWSLEENQEIAVYQGHLACVTCFLISSDGYYLISGSKDKTIRIWCIRVHLEVAYLQGHSDTVTSLALAADERFFLSGAWDGTIKIWSYEERTEVGTFQRLNKVKCLSITPDAQCVVSGSNTNTIKVTDMTLIHPERRAKILPKGITPQGNCYVCGKYQVQLKRGIPICRTVATMLIRPHYFNSLHVCAYFNQFEMLSVYLSRGVPIIRGAFGTPLTISLNRYTMKCINAILQFLAHACETGSGFIPLQEVTDDLPQLLRCNSPYLASFFGQLLVKTSQSLPEFIVPIYPLPYRRCDTSRLVKPSDFAYFENSKLMDHGAKPVEFSVSLFRWNFNPGSAQSLVFLRALEDCQDRHVLSTPIITSVIEHKWEWLMFLIRIHTLLYVCLLLCLVLMTFGYLEPDFPCLVFIALNVFFLLYELLQAVANGIDYWIDIWNYVDLARGFSSIVWSYYFHYGLKEKELHFLVVSLCFFRGFTFFRSFTMTRVFVRMVLEVVKEVYAFLLILGYSTCSFGMMYAVINSSITQAQDAWTTAYELLMGTYNNSGFGFLEWLCFTAASLVNVIIMLNLLISILADAYEKAQMVAKENGMLEMLRLVIEYESLLIWRRSITSSKWLMKCGYVGEAADENEWDGRINHIKKMFERKFESLEKQFEHFSVLERNIKVLPELEATMEKKQLTLEKKLATYQGKLNLVEERLATVEEKMEKKLTAVETTLNQRFDQVLAAVHALQYNY